MACFVPSIAPPKHKSYRAVNTNVLGFHCKIITDVNISIKDENKDIKRRKMISRYYSVKTKINGKWKLSGHTPRILLLSPTFPVSETGRQKVIQSGSKMPHAYIQGKISEFPSCTNNDRHDFLLNEILGKGGKYVHYCPYRTSSFVWSIAPKLPQNIDDCKLLDLVTSCHLIYAFEHGVVSLERNL